MAAQAYERLSVYVRLGRLYVRQGTLHQAIPLLERGVALSQDANIPLWYHLSPPSLALAYVLAGRAADALAMLGQVGENTDANNTLLCGEAYLRAGYVEEAHRLAQRVLENACHRKERRTPAFPSARPVG